jgi:hypothetical protein
MENAIQMETLSPREFLKKFPGVREIRYKHTILDRATLKNPMPMFPALFDAQISFEVNGSKAVICTILHKE